MAVYPGTSIFDILTTKYVPSTASGQTDTFQLTPGGALSYQEITGVKIKAIYGDYTYTNSSQSSLFDDLSSHDAHMCVRIFHGNLTINASQTFQPTYRCRGLIVFVKGTITNNGKISMTGWGAPTAVSQNVYLITNSSTMEYVPSAGGGGGGTSLSNVGGTPVSGNNGTAGSARGTGGGGGGTAWLVGTGSATGGSGTAGTSYCGGFGGGSAHARTATVAAQNASTTAGGNAAMSFTTTSGTTLTTGGGSGLAGGTGRQIAGNQTIPVTTLTTGATVGASAAAGLLVIYCLGNFTNGAGATIESAGKNGGQGTNGAGGSSGGGSVNVFYRGTASASISSESAIDVTGGSAIATVNNANILSGSGGSGTKNADVISATIRQTLFKVGTSYYYYDGSAWQTASGITTEDKFKANGMLDGELLNLDKSKIAQLPSVDLSAVTIQTYVTT